MHNISYVSSKLRFVYCWSSCLGPRQNFLVFSFIGTAPAQFTVHFTEAKYQTWQAFAEIFCRRLVVDLKWHRHSYDKQKHWSMEVLDQIRGENESAVLESDSGGQACWFLQTTYSLFQQKLGDDVHLAWLEEVTVVVWSCELCFGWLINDKSLAKSLIKFVCHSARFKCW